MTGPVGSEYPGTPIMLLVAGFLAYISGASARSAYRSRREAVNSHGTYEAANKRDWRRDAGLAIISLLLLAAVIGAIWLKQAGK